MTLSEGSDDSTSNAIHVMYGWITMNGHFNDWYLAVETSFIIPITEQ